MFLKSYCLILTKVLLVTGIFNLVNASAAPEVTNNPKNVIAIADFPAGGLQSFSGFVTFSVIKDLVNVHIDVAGLPENQGPFVYHIHENPIPKSLNCEMAGLHLNPYNAPEICDTQLDNSYCQVGDLSGKHGFINSTCFETVYVDPYLSLSKNSKSSILNKSIVFHYANLTKLACANIKVANRERINTLVMDYTENNPEQLQKLKAILEDIDTNGPNQDFIDELDLVEWDDESGVNIKPIENLHHKNYSNVSTFSNSTNFTGQVGDDCEEQNTGSIQTLSLFAILAGLLGFVIQINL